VDLVETAAPSASQLQVFSLGGQGQDQSPAFISYKVPPATPKRVFASRRTRPSTEGRARRGRRRVGARISKAARAAIKAWDPNTRTRRTSRAHVTASPASRSRASRSKHRGWVRRATELVQGRHLNPVDIHDAGRNTKVHGRECSRGATVGGQGPIFAGAGAGAPRRGGAASSVGLTASARPERTHVRQWRPASIDGRLTYGNGQGGPAPGSASQPPAPGHDHLRRTGTGPFRMRFGHDPTTRPQLLDVLDPDVGEAGEQYTAFLVACRTRKGDNPVR